MSGTALTITRAFDHVGLQSSQVSPALRLMQVLSHRHTRHPSQFQHIQHVSDRHHDDVNALNSGVDSKWDRVLLIDVWVSISDDHSDVRDILPVSIARCEHVVLLLIKIYSMFMYMWTYARSFVCAYVHICSLYSCRTPHLWIFLCVVIHYTYQIKVYMNIFHTKNVML